MNLLRWRRAKKLHQDGLDRRYSARWIFFLTLTLLVACGRSGDDSPRDANGGQSGPDGLAPVLTSVTLVNIEDASDTVALGETVLLTFEASETLQLPTVSIAGQPALVEGDGLSWRATRVMTQEDNDGVLVFAITFADVSGEAGAPVTSSTDDKNLRYCQQGCSSTCEAPVRTIYDFENAQATFTFLDFAPDVYEGRTAAVSMLTADPLSGGNTVVVSQKDPASEPWGGSLVIQGTPTQAEKSIQLTLADSLVSLRFWSPESGKTVKLKLEDLVDASLFVEATAVTTQTEQWQTLVFDLSNPSAGGITPLASYAKIVVFYDEGNAGNGVAQTFYWDDVTHGGLAGNPCSSVTPVTLDFEDVMANYIFADFGPDLAGGRTAVATAVVADPSDPGNRVLYSEKDADADLRGGSWVVAGTEALPEFTVTLTANDAVVAMNFWSPETGITVTLRLEVANDETVFVEANRVTQMMGAWETLYFDFSDPAVGIIDPLASYGKFVVLYDDGFAGRGEVVGFYWDDLSYGGLIAPENPGEPEVVMPPAAAPTPTVDPANVLAIFCETYPVLQGTNFNPDWQQTTVASVESIGGNETLKYAGLNYQGTELASPTDVSAYDSIHLDFWTANSTELRFSLVSAGAQESAYALAVATGQWVAVDIPLNYFSPDVDLSNIIQFKVEGNGTVFLDNWYFESQLPVVSAATLSELQTSVFTPACSGCHGGGSPSQGLSLEADFTYEYTVGVGSSEVPSLNLVESGDAENSYLYQKIIGANSVGGQMPLGGPYLSEEVTDQVKRWIEAGAQNN